MATQSKFFADLGIKSATNTEIDGNLSVSGNLTVSGTQTTIDSTTKSVADSMIELASGNTTADLTDIGIYGNYNDGLSGESGVSEYTGLFRDATDSTWKLYDGLEVEPTTTVNTSGSGYTLADLQVGDLTATTLTATNTLTGGSMTYPTSDGTDGQVIKTNGSGTLSFTDMSSGADGITASGSNTILQSPDDTSVAYINNTGFFGINHDNPTGRLHVAGHTSSIPSIFQSNGNGDTVPLQLKVKANNGTTSTQGLYGNAGSVSTDNTITLGSSPTSGLLVAGDGKVGIGMTPVNFVDIYRSDAGDAALGIKSSSAGDPTIHLDSALANRSGLINFKDQGTITGAIKYHHQTDTMEFHTGLTERLRINAGGNLLIGTTSDTLSGTDAGFVFKADGNASFVTSTGVVYMRRTGSDSVHIKFRSTTNASVGQISSDGSNTTYSTSSDYRLKENVIYDWDATTRLKQLKPAEFNFMAGNTATQNGFLAHEVQGVVPLAVNGVKDAVDDDGNIDSQSIDHSKLVPLLVKTIQELETRIATLES